jgi:hypothetical protein
MDAKKGILKSLVVLQEVYVGKEEGLRIAKEYCYFLAEQGQYQCKLCPFTSRGQCVETHVLAKHLTKLYLFRSAKSSRHVSLFKFEAWSRVLKFTCLFC